VWRAQCANCKAEATAARFRPAPLRIPSRNSQRGAVRETISPSTARLPSGGRTPQPIAQAKPRAIGLMSGGTVMSSRSPDEQEAGQRYHSGAERSAHDTARKGTLASDPSRRLARHRDRCLRAGLLSEAFHNCDRHFRLSGAWVSGETLILHEQRTAPSDDHAERQDEEKTGGLLRGDEFAYITAQRQADGRQHEDDHDEPW
jgi:hypothetical protein